MKSVLGRRGLKGNMHVLQLLRHFQHRAVYLPPCWQWIHLQNGLQQGSGSRVEWVFAVHGQTHVLGNLGGQPG